MSDSIKLHLGSGGRNIHGFINVDARADTNPDVVCDINEINTKFKDEKVELIYACHVMEHFKDPDKFLRRCFALLQPGGTLRLSVPDMKAVFKHYHLHGDLNVLKHFIWGGGKYHLDWHYDGWDLSTLTKDLWSIGFRSVRTYKWQDTEHYYVDDYSQAYLPHLDKVNGVLMSLNVEATKPE